jgi:hypothetical protein
MNMPFPAGANTAPATPRVPTGKRKRFNYVIFWVRKDEASNEWENWERAEVSSTSVPRAQTALVKQLNETEVDGRSDWKRTQFDIVHAKCMNPPKRPEPEPAPEEE